MHKLLLTLCATLPICAHAQTPSKITLVNVYPGGASILRTAKVAAGAREIRLTCLPARLETDSLKVQVDAGIQVGDVSVLTMERARTPECAQNSLDVRIRELEDQQAAIQAENGAHDLVLGYLKNLGNEKSSPGATINSTAEQLRRTGQDALQRKHLAQRRVEELEKQLTPLRLERSRLQDANPQVSTVVVRVAANNEGELRLAYRIPNASWTPQYRAYLDSAKAQLRLERHALVSQNSGEDWSNVPLRLSTVQPNQNQRPSSLPAWLLSIRPPQPIAMLDAIPMAAPAVKRFSKSAEISGDEAMPNFDISMFQGAYAAEFTVPGKINLHSHAQRTSFLLASQMLPANLTTRIQPQQSNQAYLLAEIERLQGSWPSGELQLFRDGEFITKSSLRVDSAEKMELYFGRDEMVRVQVDPELRDGANKGFITSRVEQAYKHAYLIENLHTTPITLQVLEASPVAQHADIEVKQQFTPQPTHTNWRKQPGIVAWLLPLAAGKSLRIYAEYVISYPKDIQVNGVR